MVTKNLKHGLKVSKRDTVLATGYVIVYDPDLFVVDFFSTKLDAINRLTEILLDPSFKIENFSLVRAQLIKIQ